MAWEKIFPYNLYISCSDLPGDLPSGKRRIHIEKVVGLQLHVRLG